METTGSKQSFLNDLEKIIFIDTEVSVSNLTICDYGAYQASGNQLHESNYQSFRKFISDARFLCGHNIVHHDVQYLRKLAKANGETCVYPDDYLIDTLYLSPLLFPKRPYHKLVKDDKLQTEELNNPLNDSKKAYELFLDEIREFNELENSLKVIYFGLLRNQPEFKGFFHFFGYTLDENWNRIMDKNLPGFIRKQFHGQICENSDIQMMIEKYPAALAYCLAVIRTEDRFSILPKWVQMNYPETDYLMKLLRNTQCEDGCEYCDSRLDIHAALKHYFGYENFRSYQGDPLQENAVRAAVAGESLLAVFPTGGGKSLTFQLPALMGGENARELTVVISPLQSLMKDQVDNLNAKGIEGAVAINGLLNPLERAEAIERVESGLATLLYLAPESLRSNSIERLLLSRNIGRFVIDEAHCFSAWGQDFRVDYLYIADFIRELQKKKGCLKPIPVSCFTATAKQKVIADIRDYFQSKLNLHLDLYATSASRTNLSYNVIYKENDEEKYSALRYLIEQKNCPTIVYVSRTKETISLAKKLNDDGFTALAFNGKMDSREKTKNQEAFKCDDVQIMVATSAFGMGVDKSNVGLVIHYEISDSLENYVQEAGRAGRDENLHAECYVLFNDADLDKHFVLLNQTKLSISEIQQVWSAIKRMTRIRPTVCRSPLEIAREAGWQDDIGMVETRVKTAIQALENAGYVERGKNMPRLYATGIMSKDMIEASAKISLSRRMDDKMKLNARRIMSLLFSQRSIQKNDSDDGESRIDYIADRLGLSKEDVLEVISALRQEDLLADSKDMTAFFHVNEKSTKAGTVLQRYRDLENYLFLYITDEHGEMNLKEINENALKHNLRFSTIQMIKNILHYWTIRNYIRKDQDAGNDRVYYVRSLKPEKIKERINTRYKIAFFCLEYLFSETRERYLDKDELSVQFSEFELLTAYNTENLEKATDKQIEDALLFLDKIAAIKLEGGFLVLYSSIQLRRLEMDNKIRYKKDDYRDLDEYYKQKIQQIHIVGEYASMMVRDYDAAMQFVSDYFQMDYKRFLNQYFKGTRIDEIGRNITPQKYKKLFDELSESQRRIIDDDKSRYIVVAAGPGSGKTKVLVHKLASLLLLEDVKSEQLLMLTFSRAAATEFKIRLYDLIGTAAAYVDIKTFHSYCFDILGRPGKLEGSTEIEKEAVDLIRNGQAESGKISKTVLVIDEAQDMDSDEFELVRALIDNNEEMRIIAVGDDDQNIYEFRGSDSRYLKSLMNDYGAVKYDLLDNYRSNTRIIRYANGVAPMIHNRLKTQVIHPVKQEEGLVTLTGYQSRYFDEAVVRQVMSNVKKGTRCIMTETNEEAYRLLGLLLKYNQKAGLIQSNDGFQLINIMELRYFVYKINELNQPIIEDSAWNRVCADLKFRFQNSCNLELSLKILDMFARTYQKKYFTDLKEFLGESRIEDFVQPEQDTIYVSTIHKSKGREFDYVYIMLSQTELRTDSELRTFYVGVTRAKQELHIHCSRNILEKYAMKMNPANNLVGFQYNTSQLGQSDLIITELGLQDVYLGFFKGKMKFMMQLQSGQKLDIANDGLYYRGLKTVEFSKRFRNKMASFFRNGYKLTNAEINYMVYWKEKDTDQEHMVILPELWFERKQN